MSDPDLFVLEKIIANIEVVVKIFIGNNSKEQK
jgi:hypothetical protein